MEPEGSLPCSQQPSTITYPEPDESNPRLPNLKRTSEFLKIKVESCLQQGADSFSKFFFLNLIPPLILIVIYCIYY